MPRSLVPAVVFHLPACATVPLGSPPAPVTIDPANTPSIRVAEKLGFALKETKPDEYGEMTLYLWKERED